MRGQKRRHDAITSHHDRRKCITDDGANVVRHVIAVERDEGEREFLATTPPGGLLGNEAMGHVAQRAMADSKAGTNPVRHFADDRSIGVIYTNQLVFHRRILMRRSPGVPFVETFDL